jgi:hypothetical protein
MVGMGCADEFLACVEAAEPGPKTGRLLSPKAGNEGEPYLYRGSTMKRTNP